MININSYINSYMDTMEKAALDASICHIARFLKSGIPIYNSKVPDRAGRKNKRKKKNTGNCKSFCILRKGKKDGIFSAELRRKRQ